MAVTQIVNTRQISNYGGDNQPKVITQAEYDDYKAAHDLGAQTEFTNTTFLIKEDTP